MELNLSYYSLQANEWSTLPARYKSGTQSASRGQGGPKPSQTYARPACCSRTNGLKVLWGETITLGGIGWQGYHLLELR